MGPGGHHVHAEVIEGVPGGRASSFHLIWVFAPSERAARLVEVSSTLQVLVPPAVPALYFWALQVDFADDGGAWGGAHAGLQWNQRYPGNRAVNWGGYASPERGGAVLPGTLSTLPGFVDDPNTLSYDWQPEQEYRLRVYRSPESLGAWRAEVTDLTTGISTVIRDLLPPSESRVGGGVLRRLFSRRGSDANTPEDSRGSGFLARPMVWSEVFAECDDPRVVVRWSDLRATEEDGRVLVPQAVVANYQSPSAGGCLNTDSSSDGSGGVLQTTNAVRRSAQDAVLPFR